MSAAAAHSLSIAAQLSAQGLRAASSDEAGWYAIVSVDGEPRKVWATDLALRDLSALAAYASARRRPEPVRTFAAPQHVVALLLGALERCMDCRAAEPGADWVFCMRQTDYFPGSILGGVL